MATIYKVLGQINPTGNTLTPLYTVPASTQTVVSSITICNQGSSASTFSLAVQPANAAISAKHYISFNTPINASDVITLTLGLTLGNTDVISANVTTANISINAFGSELT